MNDFLERIQTLSPKRLALLAYELQSQLDAIDQARTEAIALVGVGCRFPGGVSDPDAYWRLLSSGHSPITEVPPERWDVDAYYDPDPSTPGKTYTRWGGFLRDVDQFDPDFFGISPREAIHMDPQQRLLLEVSWEALERSGHAPKSLMGSRTGVYVAIGTNDYANLQTRAGDLSGLDAYTGSGNGFCFAAGRIAYVLGLQGPNMALDAACASSLMAVHLACQSLRAKECELALVGGVNLLLSPETNVTFSRTRVMAADGRCKTFDAAADGYVRSEGCAAIVLKRLSDAIAERDPILAVIQGSAVSHGGASGGLTIPNGSAQQMVVRTALEQAKVQPHQIQYVETQGTGTPLGDAIEVRALGAVLKQGRSPQQPLWLASVKTNIGHTETASGLASLIKVVLALQHQKLPPHLHLQQLNPEISLADIPAKIPTQLTDWPQEPSRQLAGVSAFGMSGTNAHIVLEAAPTPEPMPQTTRAPLYLLPLSAKTPEALRQLAQRYADYLTAHPDVDLGDLCFTASTGRSHFDYRLTLIGDRAEALRHQLVSDWAAPPPAIPQGPKIVFVLSEPAELAAKVSRQLYESQPDFKAAIDRCSALLAQANTALPQALYPAAQTAPATAPQPATTRLTLHYALSQLWHSWGITPSRIEGADPTTAACLLGRLSLEAALQAIIPQPERAALLPPETTTSQETTSQETTAEYRLSLHPDQAHGSLLLSELANLYQQGAPIDWSGFYRPYAHQRLILPTYPFQRQRYWNDLAERGAAAAPSAVPTGMPSSQRPPLSRAALLGMEPAQRQARLAADLCDRLATALRVSPAEITPEVALDTLAFDSIMALELKFDLEKTLGSSLSITALLQPQTIAALAEEILQNLSAESAVILPQLTPAPAERHQPFLLNDIQEAYWIGRGGLFDMGNIAAHIYAEFDSRGLDCDRLNQALQQLIARHDMLRTVILPAGQQQVLAEVPPYIIDVIDLRQMSAEAAEQQLMAWRQQLSHQIHAADQWPLFTVRAARLDDQRLRLFLSFDNLLVDGASLGLLCWEWGQLYQDLNAPLVPLDVSFRDYVLALKAFEDSDVYQRSLAYWQQRLTHLPPAPDLALAIIPAGLKQPRFTRLNAQIAPDAWQHLQKQAQQAGLTPSGLLIAAYAEVLATWSKTRCFSLNLTTFNRLPIHPQVPQIIGDFTALTLLAIDYRASESFWQRAKQVQRQLWQDLEHSYVSGVRVLRELARVSESVARVAMPVVFTSLLANPQLKRESAFSTDWLGPMVHSIAQTPQVWLDHQVYEEAGALVLNWDFVADLFPAGLIEAMFGAYVHLLKTLAAQPNTGHQARFDLLPDSQRAMQQAFNATAQPFADTHLHTRFLHQVDQRPQQLAVVSETTQLTYAELSQRSRQVAQYLQSLDVQPNQLVAIVMDKGWEQVVAALGILMAGAAYVPIDPALPEARRQYLIEQSPAAEQSPIVLTQSWHQAALTWPAGTQSLAVDTADLPSATHPFKVPRQLPTDLAYVIYTSGSTGLPKGVMIDHRGAVNTILAVNQRWQIDERDRVFALSSLSFDLSVYDLFGPLVAGGTIVMPPSQSAKDPAIWAEMLRREQVTVWNSVPALMQMLVTHTANRPDGLPHSLRLVLLSGDWLPLGLPDEIRRQMPQAEVVSLGGATEASIWSIFYPVEQVEAGWTSIPYGQPLANQHFYVLDAQLEPCPVWVPGQLYIGGAGLAKGYWRDPDKTAASFITHPRTGAALYRTGDLGRYLPSGQIEFLGREDSQVKLGGYRIELGEIEAALEQHPVVTQAVTLIAGEADQGQQLVAYVCLDSAIAETSVAVLRAYLEQTLPAYMVPQGYVVLEAIPLTANGKVDRRHLQSLWQMVPAAQTDYVAPRNAIEATVVEIWQALLGRDRIGVYDNFFELGGDSLIATRVMARVQELFQVEVSLRHLFSDPIVAQLADAIAQAIAQQADPELIAALEAAEASAGLDPADSIPADSINVAGETHDG